MNLGKKIAAVVIAAATALTALSVSAFAADVIGTNPTKLKDGEQVTAQIPYDNSNDYDNGHNYKDFIYTAPADGNMVITFDAAINNLSIKAYREDTKQATELGVITSSTGSWYEKYTVAWSKDAGIYSGVYKIPVTAGDYIIRINRAFSIYTDRGKLGNGRVHISVCMEKPEAPQDIQVTDKTDTTARLQWREPEGCTSYDLRYKAGNGDWTTIKDIMDNNVTIKKLKGATKYTYQMRSHAGDIVGDWSKAASFKTNDPKNVKFDIPKVNASVAVHVTWGKVKNATGYKFQYSTDQKNWKTITVEEPAADMPVVSGKTYYYKVAAKNSSKTGSFSKVSSIKIG